MPRNVGSIEITVDANTGRLTAQLNSAGKKAGTAFKLAAEKEMRNLQATIDFKTEQAETEARMLRQRIEAQLAGVPLDLDLGEARARLIEIAEEAERLNLVLDLRAELSHEDLAEIEADYGAWKERVEEDAIKATIALATSEMLAEAWEAKQQIEADEINIKASISLATSEMLAEAWDAKQEIEANKIRMGIELQSALAIAEAEGVAAEIESIEAKMKLDLDTKKATLEKFAFKEETEADRIKFEAELSTLRAQTGMDKFILENMARDLGLNLDMTFTEADLQMARWRREQEANDVEIKVNAKEGGGFGGGGGLGSQAERWGAAILGLGDSLSAALSGTVSAATSVLSSALSATGAAAGAATPLVAAFGSALAAGVVGTRGFSDALKEVNKEFAAAAAAGRPMNLALIQSSEAFRNLAPAAQNAAVAFAGIRDELSDLRKNVQEDLFRGAGQEIRELADKTLPELEDALRRSARSLNEFGRELADVAKGVDFAEVGKALDPALDDALDAAVALADTVTPFLMAAAPAAERLAEMIERAAEGMRDWVKANPQAIADFLDEGLTSLREWGALLASTTDLLASVFKAGSESGDSFVVSLNNMIERWDAWMEDTANADSIAAFFQTGKDAMDAFKPVLDGLKEAFSVLVTADTLSNFTELGAALGDAIPAVAQLITLIGQLQMAEAFANLVGILGIVFDILNKIPGPLLEITGTVIVLTAAFVKVGSAVMDAVKGVKAIVVAMQGLGVATPWLLAIGAAVTLAVLAYEKFGHRVDEAKARTEELTRALQDNVDAMIAAGDATNGATLGMKALNDSLFQTGEGGKKIQQGFKFINDGTGDLVIGIDDTIAVLTSLREESGTAEQSLKELAEGWGLNAEEAARMAKIVNETDDNFNDLGHAGNEAGYKLRQLAGDSEFTTEELNRLFGQLEELQDQGQNFDITKITAEFNSIRSTGDEATQALLAAAEATAEDMGKKGDAVVIYQLFTAALKEAANAADDSADATINGIGAYAEEQLALEASTAAYQTREAALRDSRAAAMKAWEDEQKLAEATRTAVSGFAKGRGVADAWADGLVAIGEAADDASAASDALSSSLDLLFGRTLDADQAFDDFQRSMREIKEGFHPIAEAGKEAADATPKVASFLEAIFGQTEAAQDFRDTMRSGVDQMFQYAAAATEAGTPIGTITQQFGEMRETLATVGEEYGISRAQSDEFIASMLGTPGLVETVIATPGLIDALLNAEDLTVLYNAAGEPVDTAFEALGIDIAMADATGFKDLVDVIAGTVARPTISSENIDPVTPVVEGVTTDFETLGRVEAQPQVLSPTLDTMPGDVEALSTKLAELAAQKNEVVITAPALDTLPGDVDRMDAKLVALGLVDPVINIETPGMDPAINDTTHLNQLLKDLPTRKVITVVTNNVTTGVPGGMTGKLITTPQLMNVGERGLREALVPLDLPLSRVNPEVRMMAAMLRGEGPSRAPTAPVASNRGPNITQYFTLPSADPAAVAQQVLNRSASLANR